MKTMLNWLKHVSAFERNRNPVHVRRRGRPQWDRPDINVAASLSMHTQPLEDRVVLAGPTSVDVLAGVLTITGDSSSDNSFVLTRLDADTIRLQEQNGHQIDLIGLFWDSSPGETVVNATTIDFDTSLFGTDIDEIQVNGDGGNDSLTLVFTAGDFEVPIDFNGGADTDTLTLSNGTTTTVAHVASGNDAGEFTLTATLAGTISYSGLESANDTLPATNRSFTFSDGADTAAVTDDGTNAGRTIIDSDFAVPVSFASPSGSLSISLGDGGDTLTISSVDSTLNAALTINGDGGTDTVTLSTSLTIGSGNTGNLSVTSEDINVDNAINTSAGTVGNVTLTASDTLDTDAGGDITAGGEVSLTGTVGFNMSGDITTNGEAVTVSGPVTQTANVVIQTSGGNVTFNNAIDDDGSLPTSSDQNLTINAGSGTVTFSGAVGSPTPLETVTVTSGTFSATSIATETSLSITNSAAGSVSGIISGAGTLTKAGNGTLTLGGNNSYTGTTSINTGTLLVNGTQTTSSSTVTVGNGTTLGGSGTVGRPVTVPGTGAIAPGTSPGTLTVGDLTLDATSVLNIELNGTTVGTQYDQLIVNGTVSLSDATLTLSVGYTPSNSHSFTIISNDGTDAVTGTLKVDGVSIPDGGSFVFSGNRYVVDYTSGSDNNDVTLTISNNAAPTAVVLTPTSVNLAEDANTSSATILSDISITDDGFGTNTLSLTGDDAGVFEIVGNQLRLKAGTALDRETKTTYTVTIRVDDESVGSTPDATSVFTLNITNVNEAPTDIALSASTILENLSSGTTIGAFSTTDPEGGSFTYELVSGPGSDDNGSFSISESNLVSNAVFNFESKSSYSIRVRSSDAGNLTVEEVFTITVVNQTEVTGINVGQGLTQRSFVRYLDILFDRSDDLLALVNDELSTRLRVTQKGLTGSGSTVLNLSAPSTSVSVVGSAVRIDFGANGITGNRSTNAGDGYYQIEVNADDDSSGTFESSNHFHRLLGDVTGNGSVTTADRTQYLSGTGGVAENDVNGDGVLSLADSSLLNRAINRTLNGSLTLND